MTNNGSKKLTSKLILAEQKNKEMCPEKSPRIEAFRTGKEDRIAS